MRNEQQLDIFCAKNGITLTQLRKDILTILYLHLNPLGAYEILEKLKESGLIRQQREIKHMVNVHERCKKEIEYLMLAQWFLRILPQIILISTGIFRYLWIL